jgi:hypothetical protein
MKQSSPMSDAAWGVKHYLRIAASVVVPFLLGACESPSAPPYVVSELPITRDVGASFQTDSLSYMLRLTSIGYAAQLNVIYTNRTLAPAHIVNCGGATSVALEKLVDGQWQQAWAPALPLCLSAPIVVAPGASYSTGISVFAGYPENKAFPKFAVTELSGVYRAVWHSVLSTYQPSLPFGEPLPLEARVSNRFTVVAPAR